MSVSETRAVRIVRALGPSGSTSAGDNDEHRKGPAEFSYGLQDIANGKARAVAFNLPVEGFPQVSLPPGAAAMETGWHYHNIQLQLGYVATGSIEAAFSDGAPRRYHAGELIVIPGDVPHNAARPSEDYGALEFTLPGEFGTLPCPAQPPGAAVLGFALDDSQARPKGDGVTDFALPAHVSGFAAIRLLQAGEDVVDTPRGGMCFTFLTHGSCEIEAEGARDSLGPYDMMIEDSANDRARVVRRSEDFRAFQIQLPA